MKTERDNDLPLFAWVPPSRVIPFPLERRRDLIERHARRMAEFRPRQAEDHLNRLLRDLEVKLVGQGCDPAAVGDSLDRLEQKIRDRYRIVRALVDAEWHA